MPLTRTLFLAVLLATQAHAQPSPFPLRWLAGCWSQHQSVKSGERVVEEQWTTERGGAMLGMSRTVNNGRMTESEFVIVELAGDSLHYKVRTGKQQETIFSARAPFGDEIIFENPLHDFPKRIGYRRITRDSVEAWIDGGAASAGKRVAYAYRRTTCGAP